MTDGIVTQDPFIGTTLDERYSLVSLISRGGLSVLYRGVDKATSEPVTVRVLINEKTEHEANAARFISAVKLMETMRHPNIVPILGSGTTPSGAPYLVLPFVDGRSVRDKVDKDGPLSYEEALPIISDIGAALEFAHQHGIVHRNLKPSNILLTDVDGKQRAVLTGFGIAKKVPTGTGESIARTSKVVGSPLYMSPEQFLNSKVDRRSDIYSFGCVVHQMLCGKPPFDAQSLVQLMGAHHHRYRDHFAPQLNLPAFVDDVLDGATMKLPGNRYASAAQMVADFHAGKCSLDLPAARKHEPAADEQNLQRQQTIKTAAIITAGSILVVALVIFIAGYDSMTRPPQKGVAPRAVAGTNAQMGLKKLIDDGQYGEAVGVVTTQISYAEASGERTEALREKLAMLLFLDKHRALARAPLQKAIATRQGLIQSEPDTQKVQEAKIRNDYALLALSYMHDQPKIALRLAETHLRGVPIETLPEKQLMYTLEARFTDMDKDGVRLREEFQPEDRVGYIAPEDTGELDEYLITAAEKD